MDGKSVKIADKNLSSGANHDHEAEEATQRLLADALTKYRSSNLGTTTIDAVRQTANGYEVSTACAGKHGSIKMSRDEVGKAMTLALLGPDIYNSIGDQNAFGQRVTTMVGGTLSGTLAAAKKEWSNDPVKATTDGALTIGVAGGLTVMSEACPMLTSTFGAASTGLIGAELVKSFPQYAAKANTLQQFYDRAGQVDGNTVLKQSHQVAEIVGTDVYHMGATVLEGAAGLRGGLALRPEVSGNLEVVAMQAASQLGKLTMQALQDLPKMFNGAFEPQGLRLAFATALSNAHTPFESIDSPGILKMAAGTGENSIPAAAQSAEGGAAVTQFQVKLTDKELDSFKNAHVPEDIFRGETGWAKFKDEKSLQTVYVRDSESVSANGQRLKIKEHFVPGQLYSILSSGEGERYEIVMDLKKGREIVTDFLACQAKDKPCAPTHFSRLVRMEDAASPPKNNTPMPEGDGKLMPHNWLPNHRSRQ